MTALLSHRVVDWFEKNKRDLPWRRTSDPYKIWVSEVMLQQTTVATVIPYYERFLSRFSTINCLANASESEVLSLWQGLGYYRRAKNLRAGAQFILKEFKGEFPKSLDDLLKVPGIGRYSAGAILSIAHRIPTAALDGNLIRVYARHDGIKEAVDDSKVIKSLWTIAESHVPTDPKQAREFTEGMMELGALICTPRNPQCSRCPLIKTCRAHAQDLAESLPVKSKVTKRKKLVEMIFWCEKNGRIGLLPKGSDPKFPDFCRLPFEAIDAQDRPQQPFKKFRYAITDRDFEVVLMRSSRKFKSLRWVSLKEAEEMLLPTIDRKIIRAMMNE